MKKISKPSQLRSTILTRMSALSGACANPGACVCLSVFFPREYILRLGAGSLANKSEPDTERKNIGLKILSRHSILRRSSAERKNGGEGAFLASFVFLLCMLSFSSKTHKATDQDVDTKAI